MNFTSLTFTIYLMHHCPHTKAKTSNTVKLPGMVTQENFGHFLLLVYKEDLTFAQDLSVNT